MGQWHPPASLILAFVIYAFCVEEIELWCSTHEVLNNPVRAKYWPAVSIPAGLAGVLMYILVFAAAYDYGVVAGLVLLLVAAATVALNAIVMHRLPIELKYQIWPALLVVFYVDFLAIASKFTWFGLIVA
jgi:hypothetical protein